MKRRRFIAMTFTIALLQILLALGTPRLALGVTDGDFPFDQAKDAKSQVEKPVERDLTLGRVLGHLTLALGVVFALMAVVVWAARRYLPRAAQAGRGGMIEVLSTRSIGRQRSLLVVRAQGKTVLLGVSPQSIQLLTEIEPDGESWRELARNNGLDAAPDGGGEESHPHPAGTTSLEKF